MDAIFFPRNDYPSNIEVCNHRLGKKMTYTEQTDTLGTSTSYSSFMALAKNRNIKTGCFLRLDSPVNNADAKADYENGKIWFDAYSFAPNIADKIINPSQYGSITEEEWETAYNNYILPNFLGLVGRKPVCLSYSYGTVNFSDYITQFLGGRNSAVSNETDYGYGLGTPDDKEYTFTRFSSKANTMRWYDQAKSNDNDFLGQLAIVSAKIDETLLNGGWLNNFTHWHNYYSDNNGQWAEAYLDLLAAKNQNGEIYFSGYGEAVAYLVYRQMITRCVMYSPVHESTSKLVIRLEAQNTLGIDTDLLQVPLSIKFSTVDTPLAGKTITSDCNLVTLGSGNYIVEIPYTGRFPKAVIYES